MSSAQIVPVLPTADMHRDVEWYQAQLGFTTVFGDHTYAGLKKGDLEIHLQWHADTPDDPVNGGSVIKIFVDDIQVVFEELAKRGTVTQDKLHMNTPWGTHEFGLFDLNKNAIFFVQDI